MKTVFASALAAFKAQFLNLITVLCVFTLPIRGLLFTVGFAILMDTIFGVLKAKKLHGWKAITSRKLSKIISKMVLYELAVLFFYCMDVFILGDFLFKITDVKFVLVKFIGTFLCFVELKSINENVQLMTGKSIWQQLKEFISRGKEIKEELSDLKDNEQPGQ